MQYLSAISMISFCSQGKPFIITVIQVYTQTINVEEAEVEWFYEELQELLESMEKISPFHYRRLECKNRKIPRVVGKFGFRVQNEAGQRLTGFCQHQQHKYPSPATQETTLHMDITKWLIPKSD